MSDGIEADTAQVASGIVPEIAGHPGVRRFVNAERKQQDSKLNKYSGNIDLLEKIHPCPAPGTHNCWIKLKRKL